MSYYDLHLIVAAVFCCCDCYTSDWFGDVQAGLICGSIWNSIFNRDLLLIIYYLCDILFRGLYKRVRDLVICPVRRIKSSNIFRPNLLIINLTKSYDAWTLPAIPQSARMAGTRNFRLKFTSSHSLLLTADSELIVGQANLHLPSAS